jgi:hypothetical protein
MLSIVASREAHSCSALCSNKGICQIDTAPQSIEATFTGRHETFQYTKVIQTHAVICCACLIILVCYVVHTRFVDEETRGAFLTLSQLRNGCSALAPFRQDKHHMRDHIHIARKVSHSTFVKLGA